MTDTTKDTAVIIAAGGAGLRFGALKQFLTLGGRHIIHYSLDVFDTLSELVAVTLVLPSEHLQIGEEVVSQWQSAKGDAAPEVLVVAGGDRRQDSVWCGIKALPPQARYVLVHDAARPLVLAADVQRVLKEIRRSGAALLGTPCADSIKRVKDSTIVEELPRDEIWAVQTPQGAALDLLRTAYAKVGNRDWTDEASLLRAAGIDPILVAGSRDNVKLTQPGDEAFAEAILHARVTR